MSKSKSPQPANALPKTSRAEVAEGWTDWQEELRPDLQPDRVVTFNDLSSTASVPSVHYLVTPEPRYYVMQWNCVFELRRWREISHDECRRLSMHCCQYDGFAILWRDVFGPQSPAEFGEGELFVPDDIQQGILKALDGRAMKLKELASQVTGGETSTLYRHGLKTELMKFGLVKHRPSLGYYRPDAPPVGAKKIAAN